MKKLAPIIVFTIALILRVLYVVEHHHELGLDVSKLPQTDNFVFSEWARIIADGDVLCREQPHAYHLWTEKVAPEGRWLEWYGGTQTYHQSPLYAYMVAAVYYFTGTDHIYVGLMQAVLGALTCLLTFVIAARALGTRAGVIAGLLLAFTGNYLFYDAFILRDGPMAFFVALTTWQLQKAAEEDRPWRWLIAGTTLGIFTLAKETGPVILLLTVGFLAWRHRTHPIRGMQVILPLVIGWILILIPVFARNQIVGAPTFGLSTRGPEVYVAGNASGQDGIGWNPPIQQLRTILLDSNFKLSSAMAHTIATHRAAPLDFIALQARKFASFMNGYEVPNNVDYDLHRSHLASLRAGFISVTFLAPAALLGMLLAFPRRRRLLVPYLMFSAIVASVVMLYILGRFRVQALPLFAVFAAVTVDWAWRAISRRRLASLLLMSIPFAGLLAFSWPEANKYVDLNKNAGIMMRLLKAGNHEQAERYYQRHLGMVASAPPGTFGQTQSEQASLNSRLATLKNGMEELALARKAEADSLEYAMHLGWGYTHLLPILDRGDLVEFTEMAIGAFQEALLIDPLVEGAWHGLGTVHGHREQFVEAYQAYGKELDLHPNHGPSHRDRGNIYFFAWDQPLRALYHFLSADAAGLNDAPSLACAGHILINPTHRSARPLAVGTHLVTPYNPEMGADLARRAVALSPENEVVLEQAAIVFYAIDDMEQSERLLRKLIQYQPWREKELTRRIADYHRAIQMRTTKKTPEGAGETDQEAGS
ncbi:MAG: glycosyltransferase family 39 protein [Planctomycetota bacterium]|nr:glycosyltransferase family 39 protein [Planctomycetota bacterium]